jgi:hypothetical protein
VLQIGTLTLRKLRELEKESGMTGNKDGAKKKDLVDEVSSQGGTGLESLRKTNVGGDD